MKNKKCFVLIISILFCILASAKTHYLNRVTKSNSDFYSQYRYGVVKFQHFTNSVQSVFSQTGTGYAYSCFNSKTIGMKFIEENLLELTGKSDWFTENTYDLNFKKTPNKSGVYLLVGINFMPITKNIIYVGSSKNLQKRYMNHEVVRKELLNYDFIKFYFRECYDFLIEEKKLIKKIQPKLNTQWR